SWGPLGVGANVTEGVAAATAGAAAQSNSCPSTVRRNRTGVAHSISLTSVNTALRASDTAASIGYCRPMSDVNSSSANTIAARSLIVNCIATTAGTPSATRLVAIP